MTIDIDTYKEICIYVCPNAYLYKVDTRSNIISVLSSLLVDFLLREKCRGNEPGAGAAPTRGPEQLIVAAASSAQCESVVLPGRRFLSLEALTFLFPLLLVLRFLDFAFFPLFSVLYVCDFHSFFLFS